MAFKVRANNAESGTIYSAGECPVCADSGALLLLKASGTSRLFLFCPLCGVAWSELPAPHHLEEILTPETLAPKGASLPTADDIREGPFHGVVEVPWEDWFPLLNAELGEATGDK